MSKHDHTSSTVSGAASLARGFFRGEVGDRGDCDPDPPEEHPDCGHDRCEEHWREECYAEDALVDTGCLLNKAWKPIEAALDAAIDDGVIDNERYPEIERFVKGALGLRVEE